MFRIVLMLLLSMFLPVSAMAGSKPIEVEFSFTVPPDKTVAGYRLYRDGTQVCNTVETSPGTMECTLAADVPSSAANYTLVAVYDNNTQSPPSPGYLFALGDGTPKNPAMHTRPLMMRINGALFRMIAE